MDADKWDDFPNNINVKDRERIVYKEKFSKVRFETLKKDPKFPKFSWQLWIV